MNQLTFIRRVVPIHIHSPIHGREFAAWMERGLRFGYSGFGVVLWGRAAYFSQQTVDRRCWLWKHQWAMIRWKQGLGEDPMCFYLNMQMKCMHSKFGLKTPPQRFPYPSLALLPPNRFQCSISMLFFLTKFVIWRTGFELLVQHSEEASLVWLRFPKDGHTIHSFLQCEVSPKMSLTRTHTKTWR